MRGRTADYVKAKNRTHLSTGDVIRVACDMLGINQAELARRSGIAEPHISAIISGNKPIGRVVAGKLADVLQISPGNILFAGEAPRKGADIEDALEKRMGKLRAQQNEIKSLLKGAMHVVRKMKEPTGSMRELLLNNLKRINKINEEEDITGIHVLAKQTLGENKGQHKG